nr:MAG TPA: hypothetical protein [Caudoviricetes sp.]DAV63177.1 MAG TPA: hypothetical protein [Caudoviricetes sp.]
MLNSIPRAKSSCVARKSQSGRHIALSVRYEQLFSYGPCPQASNQMPWTTVLDVISCTIKLLTLTFSLCAKFCRS